MAYDAIVVGARCAGAPTAMLLARRGYRALLAESDPEPRDMPLTHFILQSGAKRLSDWGLLDQVAASGCPGEALPARSWSSSTGGEPVPAAEMGDAYAPRRFVLDQILADAAVAAGDLAAFAPPSDESTALFSTLAGNPYETSRFFGVIAQTVSPTEFFSPDSIGRIMAGAPAT